MVLPWSTAVFWSVGGVEIQPVFFDLIVRIYPGSLVPDCGLQLICPEAFPAVSILDAPVERNKRTSVERQVLAFIPCPFVKVLLLHFTIFQVLSIVIWDQKKAVLALIMVNNYAP